MRDVYVRMRFGGGAQNQGFGYIKFEIPVGSPTEDDCEILGHVYQSSINRSELEV